VIDEVAGLSGYYFSPNLCSRSPGIQWPSASRFFLLKNGKNLSPKTWKYHRSWLTSKVFALRFESALSSHAHFRSEHTPALNRVEKNGWLKAIAGTPANEVSEKNNNLQNMFGI
jgi:hypothetical protein